MSDEIVNRIEAEKKKVIEAQDKLDKKVTDQIAKGEELAAQKKIDDAVAISREYKGSRASCFVYHPKLFMHVKEPEVVFRLVRDTFLQQLKSWYEICDMYQEEMVLSETVTWPGLKKAIDALVQEASREGNVYFVEALAEALWDVDQEDKTKKHDLPYASELRRRAEEIRYEDSGIVIPSAFRIGSPIKRTFTS